MIPTTNNTNDHHHHIMEDSQVSSPPSSSAAAAVVSEDAMQDSQVDESLSTTTLTTTTRTTTTSSSSNNNHNNTPPLPISPSLVGWTEPSTLQEKRSLYACGNDFVTLDQLELYPSNREYPILSQFNPEHDAIKKGYYDYNEAINKKISFFRGDVSQLEIDAVVNAANESLLGGGGIDGAIHRAAGGILRKYNALLNGCDTGCTKISPGFKLPAKYILHTAKEKSISNIQTLIKYSINQKKCRIEQMCLTFNPQETLYKLKINFDSKNPNTELIEQGFEIIKRKQETHIANCILPESTSELAIIKAIKTLCKNTTIKFEKERLSIKKKVKDTYSYLIVEYKLNDINELNRLTSTRFICSTELKPISRQFKPKTTA
ncbi:hypothetical protein FDP41_007029 [Naegleria fowleri]|uniref:Macro domain-containing protein n=1 Tax=Naegleria fowleri TaxID=5763 RepID=A0A6A5BIR4_NAEFO|nr:uncharacterized protein FDP41_007029 [Naegleria fowleri]KAF0973944.1 hypothetical protein FDP41_007029 [Naegleria fowleri]